MKKKKLEKAEKAEKTIKIGIEKSIFQVESNSILFILCQFF
jgi:hypothetical protein